MNPTDLETLLVKAVDGLLTSEEQARLDTYLAAHPEARAALEEDMEIKLVTDGLTARIRADADIEPPRASGAGRAVLGAGFTLALGAATVLLCFGLWEVLRDPEVPAVVRAALAAGSLGLALVLGYVVRVRTRALGRDPYEEVDR